MIDYIKGELVEITPTSATIECYGIGYQLNISLNTYGAISSEKKIKLYVYEAIREDAHVLYGFKDQNERELFILLISVSGVGPSTARVILSSLSTTELEEAIASENIAIFKTVKGVGPKTAQRIIIDLRDKIKLTNAAEVIVKTNKNDLSETGHSAVSALVMLGFTMQASQKTVSKILKEEPELPVEKVIKEALKRL
ncbi:MAG: Holliday junction branch migration protein RuvA [Coriobacteriia bacterium]|nr:Holliday junction branch migration protein RuvA [Coriobacteriia bacterium]